MIRPFPSVSSGRFRSLLTMACFLGTALVASAHGLEEEDLHRFIGGGPLVYAELGAKHMLTGYDHLLFLFGVLFYLRGFKDVLKLVTAFTVGHSVTLVAATFWQIQANPWLIDSVVALTVIYKAFDNLEGFPKWVGIASPNLFWAVLGIGLIHGFGLSTRLQQVPLGNQGLLGRILAFNVGVEAGQVVALLVIGLLLAGWRRTASFEKFGKLANAGLLVAGALLFLYQLHGYVHQVHAHDFIHETEEHEHGEEDHDHPHPAEEKP